MTKQCAMDMQSSVFEQRLRATKSNLFCQWTFLDFCVEIRAFQWICKRETMKQSGSPKMNWGVFSQIFGYGKNIK